MVGIQERLHHKRRYTIEHHSAGAGRITDFTKGVALAVPVLGDVVRYIHHLVGLWLQMTERCVRSHGDSVLHRTHLERVLYFNHSSFC